MDLKCYLADRMKGKIPLDKKNLGRVRGVLLLLVLPMFASLASAYEITDLQWNGGTTGKLHRGEVLTYNEYSAEVIAFPGPMESDKYKNVPVEPVLPFVGLNISKNGILINTTVLGPGESFVSPDGEMRLTAKELPGSNALEWLFESYDPWVVLEFGHRGTPELEISIDTDSSEYVSLPATEITATVILKNTGSADAVNVDLNINSELPIKRGSLKYHYDRVGKGKTISNTIAFSSPFLPERRSYSILGNASGYDVKDLFYTSESIKTIVIIPEPLKIPTMKKSTNSKIYLRDVGMVSLSLKNNDRYELKNVSIADAIPDTFKLVGNNSLHWIVSIPAYGEWSAHYLIKTREPYKEGISLPAATAELRIRNEYYMVQSNQPQIVVHGPKIVLSKQTDVSDFNPGDTVTVTVTAQNNGDTPTKVVVWDELPREATLVSGETHREEYLEANKAVSFRYDFRLDSTHPIKLPPPVAEYYELGSKGEKINISGQELELTIKPPVVTEVPAPETPTPTPEIPLPNTPINYTDNSTAAVNLPDNTVPAAPAVEPNKDVETILNLMLGCNNITNPSNATHNACSYFRLDQ